MDRTDASAISKVGPKRALLRFERLPSLYIHPGRLAQCLPPGLSAKHRDQLLNAKRLRPRLSKFLIRRLDLRPCSLDDLDTPEGVFAQLEGEPLVQAIRRIGAIWHAHSIAAIILASSLKELIAWLGKETYKDALRQKDLASAAVDQDMIDGTPNIKRLALHIERDGQRCIRAWCDHQPASLAARLILKLDPLMDVDDDGRRPYRDRGVMVTDRVMMAMVNSDV